MRQAKQMTGLESSQVGKEEASYSHFRLSCVAQSLLQRVTCAGQKAVRPRGGFLRKGTRTKNRKNLSSRRKSQLLVSGCIP